LGLVLYGVYTHSKFILRHSIDEAGRGPLAGPVVIAGVVCPYNIDGVVDSKKITKEENREALYQAIMDMYDNNNNPTDDDFDSHQATTPIMEWAICVMDAAKIDEINILQATLEGMRAVAQTIVGIPPTTKTSQENDHTLLPIVLSASIEQEGCYVVCSKNLWAKHKALERENEDAGNKRSSTLGPSFSHQQQQNHSSFQYYALIDGNRLPAAMPCPAQAIVKGDSCEFSIAAASILAKVTRDRLMRAYDELYPQYHLQQHKGYPTAQHMALVKSHGASKIHRRSFAPLKHMSLDEHGKILN
jgi:ribonuclease HII